MKTKLIISLLAFLAITSLAGGQTDGENTRPHNGRGHGPAYVDANKNGICDNYEERTSNIYSWQRYGSNNCYRLGQRQGQGQGQGQRGFCQLRCRCRNYIDDDKNGVCDHNGTRAKK